MIGLNNPYALFGLTLLPVVYLLYIWANRDVISVPSILIWKKTVRPDRPAHQGRKGIDARLLLYLTAITSGVLAISGMFIQHAPLRVESTAPLAGEISPGEEPPGLAITNAAVTESGELYAWVSNNGPALREGTLAVPEAELREKKLAVDPDRTKRVSMGKMESRGSSVTITLSDGDGLPPVSSVTLLRTGGVVSVYGRSCSDIERALRAIPGVAVRNVWGEPPSSGPAVIFGTQVSSIPEGNVAVVNPSGDCGPVRIDGKAQVNGVITETQTDPLLEGVDAGDMGIRDVCVVKLPRKAKVLISADGIPVVATIPGRKGTVLYVGFDPAVGGWQSRPSFPIFWYNFFGDAGGNYRLVEKEGPAIRTRVPEALPRSMRLALSPWLLLLMLASISGLWLTGGSTSRAERK